MFGCQILERTQQTLPKIITKKPRQDKQLQHTYMVVSSFQQHKNGKQKEYFFLFLKMLSKFPILKYVSKIKVSNFNFFFYYFFIF